MKKINPVTRHTNQAIVQSISRIRVFGRKSHGFLKRFVKGHEIVLQIFHAFLFGILAELPGALKGLLDSALSLSTKGRQGGGNASRFPYNVGGIATTVEVIVGR